MSATLETDVLVVGAGPVGLTTALGLAQAGIKVEILDKGWRTGAHSYALALHSRSLHLLNNLGVLDEILPHGQRIHHLTLYEGTWSRAQLSWPDLGRDFPFVLVVPQSRLENALVRKLEEHNTSVRWNHRLDELQPDGPEATISRLEQVASGYPVARMEWTVAHSFAARPSFIVGADGYRSQVREKLGIQSDPAGEPAVYSVFEMDSPPPSGNEVRVIIDEHGSSVVWPLAEDRCRWSFQVADGAKHQPTIEYLNSLLEARAPWAAPVSGKILWSSAVMFAPRLAQSFGRGRVWLAGDAAHMAGPVGVQSMNLGLSEGAELATRIAAVLKDRGSEAQLRDYDVQRRQVWRGLLGMDASIAPAPSTEGWVSENAARILPCIPATGADLQQVMAQIGLTFSLT